MLAVLVGVGLIGVVGACACSVSASASETDGAPMCCSAEIGAAPTCVEAGHDKSQHAVPPRPATATPDCTAESDRCDLVGGSSFLASSVEYAVPLNERRTALVPPSQWRAETSVARHLLYQVFLS